MNRQIQVPATSDTVNAAVVATAAAAVALGDTAFGAYQESQSRG